MTRELLQLILGIIQNEEVGTLFLGKGARMRRIFFAGDKIHLLDAGKEIRFWPCSYLDECDKLSPTKLDELFELIREKPQSVAVFLHQGGAIDDATAASFRKGETLEECLMVLARNAEHFFFEAGSVPEELLQDDDPSTSTVDIQHEEFLEALQDRQNGLRQFAEFFPSMDELLVLSENGIQAHNSDDDWSFRQVASLIDGFRTIRTLLADSFFFPWSTAKTLLHAQDKAWIKKTTFPELEGLVASQMTPAEALKNMQVFERAANMAVDDVQIRTRLGKICLRAGEVDKAVLQFNLIGDAHLLRNDLKKALEIYQEALRWDPDSGLLQNKQTKVLLAFASQAAEAGRRDQWLHFSEEALRLQTDNFDLYMNYLDCFDSEKEVIQHALPRLVKYLQKAEQPQYEASLYEALIEKFPQSKSIRRKFANYLLDHGSCNKAVAQLIVLAESLAEEEEEQAVQLIEKIHEIAPKFALPKNFEKLLSQQKKKDKRKLLFRLSATGVFTMIFLGGLGMYMIWGYNSFQQLNLRAYALMEEKIPPPGSPAHYNFCQKARKMVKEYRAFESAHKISLWKHMVDNKTTMILDRVNLMQRNLDRILDQQLKIAEKADFHGKVEIAKDHYEVVVELGKGSKQAKTAEEKLSTLLANTDRADKLLVEITQLIQEKKFAQAHRKSLNLLYKFPRTVAAQKLVIPVRIDSIPSGATLLVNDLPVGKTPHRLMIKPASPTRIRIEARGYPSFEKVLGLPGEAELLFDLDP